MKDEQGIDQKTQSYTDNRTTNVGIMGNPGISTLLHFALVQKEQKSSENRWDRDHEKQKQHFCGMQTNERQHRTNSPGST